MLSFLAHHPPRTHVSHLKTIIFDAGRSSITFKPPGDPYLVINRLPPAPPTGEEPPSRSDEKNFNVEAKKDGGYSKPPLPHPPNCALNPPWHIHRFQDETFRVLEGKAGFYLHGPPQPSLRSWYRLPDNDSSKAHGNIKIIEAIKDDVIVVPRGVSHTFRNASEKDELVIEFGLDPPSVNDEAFFRNAQTYRDDCRQAGAPGSNWQVMMFNRRAGTVMVLSGPPWLTRPLAISMTIMGSWLGKWLLGYRDCYDEYYSTSTQTK